jgi:hypothetical protein
MVTNHGFAPGVLDYWVLLSDWRNGSFAILLALSVLFVGYVLATGYKTLPVKDPEPVEGIDPRAPSSSPLKLPPVPSVRRRIKGYAIRWWRFFGKD